MLTRWGCGPFREFPWGYKSSIEDHDFRGGKKPRKEQDSLQGILNDINWNLITSFILRWTWGTIKSNYLPSSLICPKCREVKSISITLPALPFFSVDNTIYLQTCHPFKPLLSHESWTKAGESNGAGKREGSWKLEPRNGFSSPRSCWRDLSCHTSGELLQAGGVCW